MNITKLPRPARIPQAGTLSPQRPGRMVVAAALVSVAPPALLAPAQAADDAPAAAAGFVASWLSNSDASKEAQPHWITPLNTTTPRLEQEFRYDQTWQDRPKGVTLDNYGNGKGLELIPSFNTEVIIGVPAYIERSNAKGITTSGWADETLLLKYRFAAANEEHGNYIVTGFLGVSLPTGSSAFTNNETIITPTIAAGHGWGTRHSGLDIQSTLGIAIPAGDVHALGEPVTWNVALQAYQGQWWPEVEANYTYFRDGPNDGKSQFAYTVGVVTGRYELGQRARLIVGGGYQECVSSFKTFNHSWVLSGRIAF